MKILKYTISCLFIVLFAYACTTDEDNLYSFDYIPAPANLNAVFDITQDNTGMVTIVPNAEGAQKYLISFGDGSGEPVEYSILQVATHIYDEGVYQVGISAIGITGLKTEITKPLNVTFKAPENLQVNITKDVVNPKIVSVSATAEFATIMDVYFGDVPDEEPTHVLPGEAAMHTYAEPGDYIVKVIAKSAGAATSEFTETVTIAAASDPINLPIDFESYTVNYAFIDFGGVGSSVIDNPDASGINTSLKVGQSIKTAGAETWGGTILTLESPIDFSVKTNFKIKVWSPKVGAVVKLKVENLTNGDISAEIDQVTTGSNAWEELSFNFSSIDVNNEYQKVVLFFDFGNVGDDAIYYFDDIKQTIVSGVNNGIAGIWKIAPEAGSLGVGPGLGDISWWAIDDAGVSARACFYDDTYEFGTDGSFKNVLGGATWIEGWQGGTDACGAPVAPHDGSVAAKYTYNESAGTIVLEGKGAYLGIPKPYNGGELKDPANAPESITYDVNLSDDKSEMTIDINIGGGWWRYKLVKVGDVVASPLEGVWSVAPEAGSLGVGPGLGDISWWAIDNAGVTARSCFYNDTYVFGADGSFKNVLGTDTWIEGWQGGTDACGAPVAPHDGSIPATFIYDVVAGTVTLEGKGAYLGIPKPYNGGELKDPANAPESITYNVSLSEENTVMIVDIDINGGWWRYKLIKN